jgi:hypothetical protein
MAMERKMKNYKLITLLAVFSVGIWSADNEIYLIQSGANATIDLEQLGNGNIIGGLNSVSGTLTGLNITGLAMALDINQIGNLNKFLGDIYGDSVDGFFEFDGDSNEFTIQSDPTNTYGIDNSSYNVNVSGNTNTFTLNQGTSALASTLDLDWTINGSSNDLTFNINSDTATNKIDIDGDSNTFTYTGSGYANKWLEIDLTGDSNSANIQQLSTLVSDWLQINSTGSNGNICVIQNDGGTSTSC